MAPARKPRSSKVVPTEEDPGPPSALPPRGSPGSGAPKPPAAKAMSPKAPGESSGVSGAPRRKAKEEPKGPGVMNAKTYEQRESTVDKMSEEIDVAKHEQHSGALSAFLDMLGIRKDAPVVPANASAGAVARTYVAAKAKPTGARNASPSRVTTCFFCRSRERPFCSSALLWVRWRLRVVFASS